MLFQLMHIRLKIEILDIEAFSILEWQLQAYKLLRTSSLLLKEINSFNLTPLKLNMLLCPNSPDVKITRC